jgi:hypothetical protein
MALRQPTIGLWQSLNLRPSIATRTLAVHALSEAKQIFGSTQGTTFAGPRRTKLARRVEPAQHRSGAPLKTCSVDARIRVGYSDLPCVTREWHLSVDFDRQFNRVPKALYNRCSKKFPDT